MKKPKHFKPKNIMITGEKGYGMSYNLLEITGKRDWYKPIQKEILEEIEKVRGKKDVQKS